MSGIIRLSCPSCRGKLQITEDLSQFACGYCGNEFMVQRGGGIVSLKPVIETLKKVSIGVDKTASELAIQRLTKEIESLEVMSLEYAKSYRSREYIDSVLGCGALLTFGGIFGFIVSFIIFELSILFITLLMGIVGGLIMFYASEQTESEQDPYKKKRSSLGAELQRHRDIVSGK